MSTEFPVCLLSDAAIFHRVTRRVAILSWTVDIPASHALDFIPANDCGAMLTKPLGNVKRFAIVVSWRRIRNWMKLLSFVVRFVDFVNLVHRWKLSHRSRRLDDPLPTTAWRKNRLSCFRVAGSKLDSTDLENRFVWCRPITRPLKQVVTTPARLKSWRRCNPS